LLNNSKGKCGFSLNEISQTPTNSLLFVEMFSKEDILSDKNFLSELKKELRGF